MPGPTVSAVFEGERPRGGRPRQEINRQAVVRHANLGEQSHTRLRCGVELCHNRRVLHVAVGAGLVEFVGAQTGTSHGAVRLNRVAFVQHALFVKLRQQPPHRFHVLGVVRNVRRVHVHPVAHLTCELVPFRGVAHDRLSARVVVFLNRQLGSDIFLGDAEFFLYTQFHGKTVRIPARLAFHPMALQGLEAAENILDGTRHNVVNAWLAVGRRGAFEKHVGLVRGPAVYTLLEGVLAIPNLQPLFSESREVQRAAFRKFQRHGCVRSVG